MNSFIICDSCCMSHWWTTKYTHNACTCLQWSATCHSSIQHCLSHSPIEISTSVGHKKLWECARGLVTCMLWGLCSSFVEMVVIILDDPTRECQNGFFSSCSLCGNSSQDGSWKMGVASKHWIPWEDIVRCYIQLLSVGALTPGWSTVPL